MPESTSPALVCVHCEGESNAGVATCAFCGRKDGLIPINPGRTGKQTLQNLADRSKYMFEEPLRFFEKNQNGLLVFVPKLLGDEVLRMWHIVTFTDTRDSFFWDPQEGIYVPAEPVIEATAQQMLAGVTSNRRVSEALEYVKRETFIEREKINPPLTLVALKNCLFDITKGEALPFSKDFFFENKLPFEFKPGARCDEFLKFLSEILPQDDQEIILDLIGYCLYRDYPIQKAFMFYGCGSNGKSTLIEGIRTFLGPKNTTSVPIQKLGKDRFAPAELHGKLANLEADIPSYALTDVSMFKKAVGGDTLYAEKKNKQPFQFRNHAKIIYSANTLPRSKEITDAYFRRWILIAFNVQFDREKCDVRKLEKITSPEELSGLFNVVVMRLPTLLERGLFTASASTQDLRKAYIELSDPISAFAEEQLETCVDAYVPKDELYAAYGEFCEARDIKPEERDAFFKRLLNHFTAASSYYPHVGDGRVRCIKGIKFSGKPPNTVTGGQTTL